MPGKTQYLMYKIPRKILWCMPICAGVFYLGNATAQELLPPPMLKSKSVPVVQYLNEDALQNNLAKARKNFKNTVVVKEQPNQPFEEEVTPSIPQSISAINQEGGTTQPYTPPQITPTAAYFGSGQSNLPLEKVSLRLLYEDKTLTDIMLDVERLVRAQAGPWRFAWRLKDENKPLLSQRVSLNAESTFDVFLSNFIDKINNLTGTRLFVKVFNASQVIVISDSF